MLFDSNAGMFKLLINEFVFRYWPILSREKKIRGTILRNYLVVLLNNLPAILENKAPLPIEKFCTTMSSKIL